MAPSFCSSAARMREEKSVSCASVSVACWLSNVTRTSSENFPGGTFLPRNRSTASIEEISAIPKPRMVSAHGGERWCHRRGPARNRARPPGSARSACNAAPRGRAIARVKRIEFHLREKDVLAQLESSRRRAARVGPQRHSRCWRRSRIRAQGEICPRCAGCCHGRALAAPREIRRRGRRSDRGRPSGRRSHTRAAFRRRLFRAPGPWRRA